MQASEGRDRSKRSGRRYRWRAASLVAVAVSLVAAACGGSGDQFVSNRSLGTFMRLPGGWSSADRTGEYAEGRVEGLPQGIDLVWLEEFRSPPSGTSTGGVQSDEVIGRITVLRLSGYYRDTVPISRWRAATFVAGYDPLYPPQDVAPQATELVSYQELDMGGGVAGSRLVANLDVDEAPGTESWVTQDVVLLIDDSQGIVYRLSVHCSGSCYEHYRADIDRAVSSFTVRNGV